MEETSKTSVISRLAVFLLLGVVIFITIYAAQNITSESPKTEISPQTPTALTPTPSIEILDSEEEATSHGIIILTPEAILSGRTISTTSSDTIE